MLHRDIIATVSYFDVFEFPATAFELWHYRINTARLSGSPEKVGDIRLFDFLHALKEMENSKHIVFQDGFYCLPGREFLVPQRIRRSTDSLVKLRKVQKTIRRISWLPFIRMVLVTGRLATKNTERSSDWDVLVAMKHGRIWTGRTLLTITLHLLGKRRWGIKTKDRVCLNYYITDKSLSIAIKDLFAAREYAFALPLIGPDVFQRFLSSNTWIRSFLPGWDDSQRRNMFISPLPKSVKLLQSTFEKIVDSSFVEAKLREWQQKKIRNNPKSKSPESYIVADDNALIFLPSPQGPKAFEKFKKRLKDHAL